MKDVFWWWKSVFYVWVVCWKTVGERERGRIVAVVMERKGVKE